MDELQEKGYVVLPSILTQEKVEKAKTLFFEWLKSVPQYESYHKRDSFHGIMKYGEIGHQKHTWFIKTCPEVQKVFKELWATDELVTGFDGTCWIPPEMTHPDTHWTHTDQAASAKGLHCIQGLVSLTSNVERTFVVYEKSHILHEHYMNLKGFTGKRNWRIIDKEYLKEIECCRKVVKVNAGDMILWDSRTFHQSQYGNLPEERLVQYVCFLPKNHRSNNPLIKKKRKHYFERRITTSHWPYPLQVNAYYPPNEVLDIPRTDISEYEEEIQKII